MEQVYIVLLPLSTRANRVWILLPTLWKDFRRKITRDAFLSLKLACVYIGGGHSSLTITVENLVCPVEQMHTVSNTICLNNNFPPLLKLCFATFHTCFWVFCDQTPADMRDPGGEKRGVELLQYCWWPIYHISALQCFGSHEGGSLNCPKTASGWRLFPRICRRRDTRAIYL